MAELSIPADEVVSLDAVSDGVAGLRTIFVNVFAIVEGAGWTLVDAGIYGSATRILRWAEEHVGDRALEAIVLTHAHFDHVGALHQIVEVHDVPVYVHADELDYLRGTAEYPAPDPSVGGGLMARMSGLYPRKPAAFTGEARVLPSDGRIPHLPEWQWLPTPGHTAGHVSLFRPGDRTLIVGDAFCTTRQESLLAVATQRPELHGPPAYFTTDWDAARESVRRLADLDPMFIAPGHGQPMSGTETAAALRRLAERFDEVARPATGKYVEHPARR
jgi:glyoxylase-like metal-dependent hydrolase (beta-lactamase superfamily II)